MGAIAFQVGLVAVAGLLLYLLVRAYGRGQRSKERATILEDASKRDRRGDEIMGEDLGTHGEWVDSGGVSDDADR